jgi:hypothetical protein
MVCERIRVSFYKHEYMVLRLVDQVKGRLRVTYEKGCQVVLLLGEIKGTLVKY